jgi:hypothetical protein
VRTSNPISNSWRIDNIAIIRDSVFLILFLKPIKPTMYGLQKLNKKGLLDSHVA